MLFINKLIHVINQNNFYFILLKSTLFCNQNFTIKWLNDITLMNCWKFVKITLCIDIVIKLNRKNKNKKKFKNDIYCSTHALY